MPTYSPRCGLSELSCESTTGHSPEKSICALAAPQPMTGDEARSRELKSAECSHGVPPRRSRFAARAIVIRIMVAVPIGASKRTARAKNCRARRVFLWIFRRRLPRRTGGRTARSCARRSRRRVVVHALDALDAQRAAARSLTSSRRRAAFARRGTSPAVRALAARDRNASRSRSFTVIGGRGGKATATATRVPWLNSGILPTQHERNKDGQKNLQ